MSRVVKYHIDCYKDDNNSINIVKDSGNDDYKYNENDNYKSNNVIDSSKLINWSL